MTNLSEICSKIHEVTDVTVSASTILHKKVSHESSSLRWPSNDPLFTKEILWLVYCSIFAIYLSGLMSQTQIRDINSSNLAILWEENQLSVPAFSLGEQGSVLCVQWHLMVYSVTKQLLAQSMVTNSWILFEDVYTTLSIKAFHSYSWQLLYKLRSWFYNSPRFVWSTGVIPPPYRPDYNLIEELVM